jgi:hypothetical protein
MEGGDKLVKMKFFMKGIDTLDKGLFRRRRTQRIGCSAYAEV